MLVAEIGECATWTLYAEGWTEQPVWRHRQARQAGHRITGGGTGTAAGREAPRGIPPVPDDDQRRSPPGRRVADPGIRSLDRHVLRTARGLLRSGGRGRSRAEE